MEEPKVLPGFNNVQFVESARLSLSSASFDIWFNFDKSMFGLLVMGIVLHGSLIRSRADAQNTLSAVWLVALLGIVAVYAVGLLSGYSRFDWTPAAVFIPWALKNLVFTVVAEEVFFRGSCITCGRIIWSGAFWWRYSLCSVIEHCRFCVWIYL